MGTRSPILLRPHWIINNQLTLPLVTVTDTGKTSIRGLIQMAVPITIFLDTLFSDNNGLTSRRSLESDQYHVYKSIEGILQTMGIDGKSCLLRTICEMQMNPIGEFTVVGEIITILLTPKRGLNDFLHEYLESEHIGQSQNASCSAEYPTCPVSLYNLFRAYGGEGELEDDEITTKTPDEDENQPPTTAHNPRQNEDPLETERPFFDHHMSNSISDLNF